MQPARRFNMEDLELFLITDTKRPEITRGISGVLTHLTNNRGFTNNEIIRKFLTRYGIRVLGGSARERPVGIGR